jgi:hypothetical protein
MSPDRVEMSLRDAEMSLDRCLHVPGTYRETYPATLEMSPVVTHNSRGSTPRRMSEATIRGSVLGSPRVWPERETPGLEIE